MLVCLYASFIKAIDIKLILTDHIDIHGFVCDKSTWYTTKATEKGFGENANNKLSTISNSI